MTKTSSDYMVDTFGEESITVNSPITDYFRGKSVFLTGGTGFLGQLYAQKLLSIGVKQLYLLVRPKKNVIPTERINRITSNVLFNILSKDDPNFKNRIKVIEGDISKLGLGISAADESEIINNVNIVIHSAADIQFDRPLLDMIMINLRGTREMLRLCEKIKGLDILLHVSTAYVHSLSLNSTVEETFFPTPFDPHKMIELADRLTDSNDRYQIHYITDKLIQPWPNTYTFTKAMGEELLRQYGSKLPIAVVRPSVVISTYSDPITAWTNNMAGLNGFVFGVAMGLLRTVKGYESCLLNTISADFVTNSTLAIAWDRHTHKKLAGKEIMEAKVYHITSNNSNLITLGVLRDRMITVRATVPNENVVMYPTCEFYSSPTMFRLATILYHVVPGILFDTVFHLTNSKTRLLPIFRKIQTFVLMFDFFTRDTWVFRNENIYDIEKRMTDYDKKLFTIDSNVVDWETYVFEYLMGIRKYLMREPSDPTERGYRKHRILKSSYYALKFIKYFLLTLILYKLLTYLFSYIYFK